MSRDPLTRNNVTLAGNRHADRTLIFLNGLGADQSVWRAITPAFSEQFRLVLFDHVGSVPSNLDDFRAQQVRYMSASGYARDLLEICTDLNLQDNTILIGHSVGAMAAALAAVQDPGRFRKLVLIGASPRYIDADGYTGGFGEADIAAIYSAATTDYQAWATAFSSAAAGERHPEAARRLAESITEIPQDMLLTVLCSILQGDHRAAMSRLSIPTLIVQSASDCFVPRAVAEYLHARISGSQLKVISADGHLPHLTAPLELIEALRSFIETS